MLQTEGQLDVSTHFVTSKVFLEVTRELGFNHHHFVSGSGTQAKDWQTALFAQFGINCITSVSKQVRQIGVGSVGVIVRSGEIQILRNNASTESNNVAKWDIHHR